MWHLNAFSILLCASLQPQLILWDHGAEAATDLQNQGFEKIPFELIPTWETDIFLGTNNLRIISANAFSNLTSLKVLGLNKNILYFIDDTALKGTQLTHIGLLGNRLTSLSFLAPIQETLMWLQLGENRCLQSLDSLDFSKFEMLLEINLSGTSISHVPDLGSLVPSLETLNLLETEFLICDCRLAWLKGQHRIDNLIVSSYPCQSTHSLMDHEWKDIDQSQLVCSGKRDIDQSQLVCSGKKDIDQSQLVCSGKKDIDQSQLVCSGNKDIDQSQLMCSGKKDIDQSQLVCSGKLQFAVK